MTDVTPFRIAIPQDQLDDLNRRLDAARWPDRELVDDWDQGAPLAFVREVCDYWRNGYDWRRCEAQLNALGQFKTVIDGVEFHFIHVRSRHEGAMPLLLTHGWPGSVVEFLKCIGPLTDPTAHGGRAEDAFDVVIPSLPGVGFSAHPRETGWAAARVAEAWTVLMNRLGYDRWVAQGGDWGAMVTEALGQQAPEGCLGIHVNMPIVFPTAEDAAVATPAELGALKTLGDYNQFGNGYMQQQSTRPQTLAYGLTDSPVGQAAWILEKFREWSDNDGDPRSTFTMDEMLDNIMLYWLNACAGSSGRLYWDTSRAAYRTSLGEVPMRAGISIFPKELFRPSRRWAERRFTNIAFWNEHDRGGHFAAFEQPERFVQDMRDCFRPLR